MDSRHYVVFIVDDDRRIREALTDLLSSFDMHAIAFGSAAEYMAYPKPDVPACLVLDVQLPDINGLDLQSQIAQGNHPHIVFITGHGDIPSSVRAIKAGAVDFLPKPLKEADLMRAIHAALAQNRDARQKRAQLTDLSQRLSCLTPREREVLTAAAFYLLNDLGPGMTAMLKAFGAGALIAMAAETMIPEAFHNGPRYSGVLAASGFGALILLSAVAW